MEEKTVLINALKINFKVAGQGPAILVLHGWGGSSSSWTEVLELLSSKGYKVVCPDFPGFGKSETSLAAWDVAGYMEWVVSFIESQDLDEFFLLGHSFGGRVAIKFALLHPERIQALILCNSTGIKHTPGFKTRIIFILAYIGNIIFSSKFLARLKDKARHILYSFLRHKDYVKAKGVMRQSIKKVLEEDLLPVLSEIKTKTLIIWGEKDKMVPVKDAYIFNEKIDNSKLEILAGTGHSPHLEKPEELVDIILKFLR